jgi:hypothetical protein
MQIMTALRLMFLHSPDIVSNHPVIFKNVVKNIDDLDFYSYTFNK